MDITGKLPKQIVDKLNSLNIIVEDVQIAGDDIDIILTDSSETKSNLYAVYTGDNRWEVSSLDDAGNFLPEIEEGDIITTDLIIKLFINKINSSLILSFNPLGKVKYGLQDIGKKVGKVAKKVKDWATDEMYADEAEDWIRHNGPFERTYTDPRDGKSRTKKDFNAREVNLGKLESLGKQGHYKALSGNPSTKDFQVWHLYKNGNKIRCLDVKTGLQAEEAQWVYDNNIPSDWTEADWNQNADTNNVQEGKTEEQKDTENKEQTQEGKTEEQKKPDMNDTTFTDEDWDNVTDEIQSSKEKNNHNGDNVTGCIEGTNVVLASVEPKRIQYAIEVTEEGLHGPVRVLATEWKGMHLGFIPIYRDTEEECQKLIDEGKPGWYKEPKIVKVER